MTDSKPSDETRIDHAAEARALIAEARDIASGRWRPQGADLREVAKELADALEAALAEPDERAARFIAMSAPVGCSLAMDAVESMTRMIEAENESRRRSAQVPVSRDELARFIGQWMADDHAGFGSCNAPRDMATDILAAHDIYPKADRKPVDTGEAER